MNEQCDYPFGYDENGKHSRLKQIVDELNLTHRAEVARRHVGMDVFRGVLPILGIATAGIITAQSQQFSLFYEATVLGSVGTAIAFFVEGFFAAYLTETAEGKKIVSELEETGRTKLSHSVIVRAEHHTTLYIALLDGAVPSLTALATLSPMLLPLIGVLTYLHSFYASLTVGFVMLIILGSYYARIGEDSVLKHTTRTIAAGVLTIAILVVLALVTGA